jgi:hypothetical protein
MHQLIDGSSPILRAMSYITTFCLHQANDEALRAQPPKMTVDEADLFREICNYSLDAEKSPFPFSFKLSWEYRWSMHYTQRVIEEYKKFIFLAMVANHVVSPPTHVDRVWHLHLLYTHNYWIEFCGGVLGRSLHHRPSLGGASEGDAYLEQYALTLETYRHYFGEPPLDIWHPPRRKSEPIAYQWVNTQDCIVLPNPLRLLGHWCRAIGRC